MAHTVISSSKCCLNVISKSSLTERLLHETAEAFTDQYSDGVSDYQDLLRSTFGDYSFRWYCIDMSDLVHVVTFTNVPRPRVLEYQGRPSRISTSDADTFEIRACQADCIRIGRLERRAKYPRAIHSL